MTGAEIERLRVKAMLSRKDVARAAGICVDQLYQIERWEWVRLRPATARRVVAAIASLQPVLARPGFETREWKIRGKAAR